MSSFRSDNPPIRGSTCLVFCFFSCLAVGFLDVFIAAADVSNAAGELSSGLGLKKTEEAGKGGKKKNPPQSQRS